MQFLPIGHLVSLINCQHCDMKINAYLLPIKRVEIKLIWILIGNVKHVIILLEKFVVALKRAVFAVFEQSLIMLHFDLCGKMGFLGTFTTDTSGQLDVLGHDGDTLGVEIMIFISNEFL